MEIVYKCTSTRPCHKDSKRLSQDEYGFIDMCGRFEKCQFKEKRMLLEFDDLSQLQQQNESLAESLQNATDCIHENNSKNIKLWADHNKLVKAYEQLQQQNEKMKEALKTIASGSLARQGMIEVAMKEVCGGSD